ncbi:D-aminoacyl-tRNA deacylase [Wenyingzhuangia sp. 2_MG-2023]|uniref:D-aminoacyl-tRNA deacylase n=1 Tax=Wenyingzhuangia sp. 2_MG-2023 TaxID=3062639 RepID=UPI0026E4109F|nr:D-aminoacyl-tRNA deacylase [Wenyingzhuangia sp. 2_MG-2023]MDO6737904.1 D-aminoacyl-tRNA deacylase [Wenyingzhuangia sp. 2_MG-2023]MDO6802742.1 D-aminoacyl-tRNA deacylase [Wenyingzhuangia sp. 1_MG-2023]
MRVVVQRVSEGAVTIDKETVASIASGLVVLVGIVPEDTQEDVEWLCHKIVKLRIFGDENNQMNLSVKEVDGDIIVVSQFTLHALTKKGNRPSYIKAAKPEIAVPIYESFKKRLSELLEKEVQSGQFGADMKVALVNDGPVTLLIDSHQKE